MTKYIVRLFIYVAMSHVGAATPACRPRAARSRVKFTLFSAILNSLPKLAFVKPAWIVILCTYCGYLHRQRVAVFRGLFTFDL